MTAANDVVARSVLDTVAYMVLSTVGDDGSPWASPVWFASDRYRDLYWISRPDAQHSRNIAVNPDVAIVVFDSTQPPATRQAVYMRASAAQVDDPNEIIHGVSVFTRDSIGQDLGPLEVDEVAGSAALRLYHAHVHEHWILELDHDVRVRAFP
jgi:nitroimidazol reductase NimA-like FMN-containing flavoprotein (pyridoxamine 5'-phosphate oxidase superfamily)